MRHPKAAPSAAFTFSDPAGRIFEFMIERGGSQLLIEDLQATLV